MAWAPLAPRCPPPAPLMHPLAGLHHVLKMAPPQGPVTLLALPALVGTVAAAAATAAG
eukprot:CAMPEP_0202878106 /NCGR_PEP_ID=MMETSP1391-20130828/31650_1 /ASSEMBLY_ACC=CAM_ASM_000867 /TAXON_ID=1034604 /ORGANISM="Chlamydomonas leiostraca, Strain SAG 11-49" /LENGTH=57 /DNA_ID=CAMNT_0049560247 /DNA_START=426 /DNA_END=595 /DNA_ORIENTATION=+